MTMLELHSKGISIRKQCRLLNVTRSTLYYKHALTANDSTIANEIHEIWLEMPCYGYRKITKELNRRGYKVNHKKVLQLMREMKIQALYPKPRTSIKQKDSHIYPYLLKDIAIKRPDHVWQTDITYVKLSSGFMYLVAIIDVYSRFVVDWSFSNTMDVSLCLGALTRILATGKKPEIVNTDQGSQFTSKQWIDQIEENEIKVSMDGKGRWADNIFIERFWRTIKYEFLFLFQLDSAKDTRNLIAQFIETYNYKRLHQSLNYKTPAEVYLEKEIQHLPPAALRGASSYSVERNLS